MTEKMTEYLSNAQIAFTNSQYDVALEWCEKAIAEDATVAEAYTGAGKACLVLDKLQESEKYFVKAAELDSINGEKYFDLGNIKFGLAQYTEALLNYAKAEQYGCSDEVLQKLYYQIGMLSHMSGDSKSALLNFEKAESIGAVNADTKEILLKRLQIYIESEDYRNAENYAIQLKMLAPGEFRSYQIYFQILIAVGKFDKAESIIAEAEKYADVDSNILNKADIYFDKAMICAVKAEKDPDNAKQHYQSAIAVFDELLSVTDLPAETIVNASFSKAEVYLKLEQFDDALACVESIEESDESREKICFIRLSCYFGKEDYVKAVEYAEILKQSANEYYGYFATYADVFATNKLAQRDINQAKNAQLKYDNAVAFFKKKAFENPQDVFALIFRTRLYAENGKFFKAEELIKLLPDVLRTELRKYVDGCRSELEKGGG